MDLHSPKVFGDCELNNTPTEPKHAVNKQFLDETVAGALNIVSVVPQNATGNNLVGLPEYLSNTIPADIYPQEVTTNVAAIRVNFNVEPLMGERFVTVKAAYNQAEETASEIDVPVENFSIDPACPSRFIGFVDITLDELKTYDAVTLTSSTGSTYTVNINILVGGPEVSNVVLGAFPGSQTALKSGDKITVSGVVDNTAESIKALSAGIANAVTSLTLGEEDSAGAGYRSFTGELTVSNRSGSHVASIVAVNLLGTEGDAANSDAAPLDQTYPTIGNASYSYPAGQGAIKGTESVTVDVNVSDADAYSYTTDSGLVVADPSVYGQSKVVSRSGEDITYNLTGNVYHIEATRTSNDATSTKSFAVKVVTEAPTAALSFLGNPARLRSDADGENYTVQVTPNQPLLEAPDSLDLDVNAGVWAGSWTKSGNNYRRVISVTDLHARGTHTFENLGITGLSGLTSSTISSGANYEIGGFLKRQLTVPALSQLVAIGTNVSDISKVEAFYAGADQLVLQNSVADVAKGFTITDDQGVYDPNGGYIFITDQEFAGANSSGTLTLEIEETV